jgi:hypothetical protein
LDRRQWINYVSDKPVKTYVFKENDDLAGYFELIYKDKNEAEIAYFGILRRISK